MSDAPPRSPDPAAGAGDAVLHGVRLVLATLAVSAAGFMNVLDTTIAVVSLPTIAGNLAATPSQGSWVITSYGVCLAVVLPLSGWITRRFGEVHVFCISVLLFTFTSWLCGTAASFTQLILYRGLQGFAGGLLLPLSQSLLMRIYPPEKHGLALALWGMFSATAPVVGPLLGGYLTDSLGWPWIFYVNVPVGLIAAYMCWTLLRSHESPTRREPVDAIGLVLLVVGVICFQLVLDRGHELDWLSSPQIRVMLCVSVVCFFLFLAWERDEAHPVVDLSLFRFPNFALGNVLISIFYAIYILGAVIYPIWMQTIMGYTATWSGIVMATTSVMPLLLMPVIGSRLRSSDPRPLVTFGAGIAAFSFYLASLTNTDVSPGYIVLTRITLGFSMAFTWMPLMMQALIGLPPHQIATATGLFNFMRMLASSMGTALGVTIWDDRSIYHRARLGESLSADAPGVRDLLETIGRTFPDPQSPLAVLDAMATRQARTLAIDDVFYLCMAGMVLVAVAVWFMPTKRNAGATVSAVVTAE